MTRVTTKYKAQRNRCPLCGHRLSMKVRENGKVKCRVETSDPDDSKLTKRCRCEYTEDD